jgi:hypothetical protein
LAGPNNAGVGAGPAELAVARALSTEGTTALLETETTARVPAT